MATRDPNKVVMGFDRAENTQTVSSPHTYAFSATGTAVPSTVICDTPVISNISIRSAVAGIHASHNTAVQANKTNVKRQGLVKKETHDRSQQQQRQQQEEEQQQQQQKALHIQRAAVHTAKQTPNSLQNIISFINDENTHSTTRKVQTLSFDMSHTSPPIANMLRRLMSTQVPTLAFDRVLIDANDGVVLDELLSHRLGLVPIAGPVSQMEYITQTDQVGFDNLDPTRVLVFEINVQGQRDVPVTPIYSSALKWIPLPGQERWKWTESNHHHHHQQHHNNNNNNDEKQLVDKSRERGEQQDNSSIFLVHPDILLTKLGPFQQLKLRAIAIKGLGIVHAKWSPVSSCYYEMKTSVSFKQPITGDDAQRVLQVCPPHVFCVDAQNTLQVCDVKKCQLARDVLRREGLQQLAQLIVIEKDKTTVRFHVQSIGQLYAAQIVHAALRLFAERCRDLAQLIQGTQVNVLDKQNMEE